MKTKTTVELTTEELIRALEQGTFTGQTIKNVKYQYKNNVWYQNGLASRERVISSVVFEVEA